MSEKQVARERWSTGERVEVALVLAASALAWPLAPALMPSPVRLGNLLLALSALLLLQSLLRDLWLLARRRREGAGPPPRVARCMCVESTVGATGIVAGIALVAAGSGGEIALAPWEWTCFAGAVLVTGFLIKDLVFEWSPWRLRRDPDHVNIVVTWRR